MALPEATPNDVRRIASPFDALIAVGPDQAGHATSETSVSPSHARARDPLPTLWTANCERSLPAGEASGLVARRAPQVASDAA